MTTVKTFAEHIFEKLENQLVEVLIGESYEELQLDQLTSNYPAVVVGKIIEAFGNVLVLDCSYYEKKQLKSNKILYINDFTIKCLSPIDGNVSIEELLLRSRNTKAIKVNT